MNNALDNILNRHRVKGAELSDLTTQEFRVFTLNLIREALRLEHSNSGSPGKAAIEYLLNQKYEIVQDKRIERSLETQLLGQVDQVIDMIVKKFKVDRSGKNFYFDEGIEFAIIAPDKFGCDTEGQIIANLYAAKQELNVLRMQLVKTQISNPASTKLAQDAVINKEREINYLQKKLANLKSFNTARDNNSTTVTISTYRRLGEDTKKAAAGGAVAGAALGGVIAGQRAKKETGFYDARKEFNTAIADQAAHQKALTTADRNAYLAKLKGKGSRKTSGTLSKLRKQTPAIDQKMGAAWNNLLDKQIKVNGRTLKGMGKGALIGGAALGAGALIKKHLNKQESVGLRLLARLNKLPINEDNDGLRNDYRMLRGLRNAYNSINPRITKAISTIRRNKGLKAASIAGALLIGAAGLTYIIQKAREKGPDRIKNSIRSTQSKAKNSQTLTSTQKRNIQNNGNIAINKINQVFKNRK